MSRPDFIWHQCPHCKLWIDAGTWTIELAIAVHMKRCTL